MPEVSTTRGQRIIIWTIAIVMAVGTIGSFFIFMLPSANTPVMTDEQKEYEKQIAEYLKQQEEVKKSLMPLDGYQAEAFDAGSVKELKVDQIQAGEGKDVIETSTISANYFGWTSDGKIFDSTRKTTNKDGAAEPVDFPLDGVIKGWTQGLAGQKEGAIVKLTIPSDMAYGESQQGGTPSGPLMFIVEIKAVK